MAPAAAIDVASVQPHNPVALGEQPCRRSALDWRHEVFDRAFHRLYGDLVFVSGWEERLGGGGGRWRWWFAECARLTCDNFCESLAPFLSASLGGNPIATLPPSLCVLKNLALLDLTLLPLRMGRYVQPFRYKGGA